MAEPVIISATKQGGVENAYVIKDVELEPSHARYKRIF